MIKFLVAAFAALFAAAAFAAVDVNKATQAELEAVKGVGPGIAGKILDERKKGTFKVTLKNTGTASAKSVKVKASGGGKGSASGGTIKPGTSKTVKVKVKVTGKKGRKATLQFKATGGASSTGNIKVTVG